MWGTFNKSLGDLTTKTLSTVAKAGLRAKEIINQVDADDFFERELNDAPVDPLKKPEVKPKNKDKDTKSGAKENQSEPKFGNEEPQVGSGSFFEPTNSKEPTFKKNKGLDASPISSGKGKSDSFLTKSLDMNPLLSQPTQSTTEKMNKSQTEIGEETVGVRKSADMGNRTSDSKKKSEKVAKEDQSKQLEELRAALQSNEEALETYAMDNDRLVKEKNEIKELADAFQSKNSVLDKELTSVLAKNTSLEEQVNKLKGELEETRKRTKTSDIHMEVTEDRKEAISSYIEECVGLFKGSISTKAIQDLNQDLLNQIASEEEGIAEEARELLQSWMAKGDIVKNLTEGVVPEEKIIKPFYDENILREEIECHKQESNRLRTQAEEYEERLRQMEAQLKEEQAAFMKYKEDTEQTLKKYTEDFVRVEQNLENAEDEARGYKKQMETRLKEEQDAFNKYKEETEQTMRKYTEDFVKVEQNLENLEEETREYKLVLKARGDDILRLEKTVEEKQEEIRRLDEQLRKEIEAKEDLSQQYDGIVNGMKDFEGTMAELNRENEKLSKQHGEMVGQLNEEKKRAKDIEHTLSVEAKDKLLEKLNKLNALNKELNIRKVVEPRLTVQEGRISAAGFGEALEEALEVTLDLAHKRFGGELEEEKGRERERYEALSANFEKLQGELREALKREKEVQSAKEDLGRQNTELSEIVDNLNLSVGNYTNKIQNMQKMINELQETKKRYLDEAAAKNGEIEQLKMSLNSLQEEREENANYIARLEAETGEIPELQAKLEKQAIDIGNLGELVHSKEEENAQLEGTIANLQSVIDENQQIQESMSSQYTNEIKKLRGDLEQSTRKSQILQEYKDKFEVLEKEAAEREAKIKELNMKLKETEQEKNAVSAEAAALIKKAKNDALYKEHLVDKRVVTNCLVKYFDPNATFPVKVGILETMSSILGLSDDDRVKMGLTRQTPEVSKPESPSRIKSEKSLEEASASEKTEAEAEEKEKVEEQQQKPQKSFGQMFMSFLMENK